MTRVEDGLREYVKPQAIAKARRKLASAAAPTATLIDMIKELPR